MKNLKIKEWLRVCAVAIFVVTMFSGCSKSINISNNLNKDESNISTDKENIENENNIDREENSNKENENIDKENENVDKGNESIDKENTIKKEEFTLYSMDANDEEEVILGKVEIDNNKTLEEKLTELANAISEAAFDGLPLEFVKIENIKGKQVALFNFNELGKNGEETQYDKYEGKNWIKNYFSGSTGGRITEYTLQRTLLQYGYNGKWVDGIKFTYKGENIEFDHVPNLSEIIYK